MTTIQVKRSWRAHEMERSQASIFTMDPSSPMAQQAKAREALETEQARLIAEYDAIQRRLRPRTLGATRRREATYIPASASLRDASGRRSTESLRVQAISERLQAIRAELRTLREAPTVVAKRA